MTDDMYERLRAANPVPGSASVEAADSSGTRALMEAVMSTELNPSNTSNPSSPRSRWLPAAIAAAAAGVILAGALLIPDMLGGDDPATPPAAALELAMPGTDPSMGSCIPLSADELSRMPVAFAGTATSVTEETVSLDVETWYQGGDASRVELTNPASAPVSLLGYGIEFEVGTRYLITATGGTVNVCGFSGEATPELEAIFDEAFAG